MEETAQRGLASLRTHIAWEYSGLGTLVKGAVHMKEEEMEVARQNNLNDAGRRRNRILNQLGRSLTAQADRLRRSLSPDGAPRSEILAEPDPHYANLAVPWRPRSPEGGRPSPIPGELGIGDYACDVRVK